MFLKFVCHLQSVKILLEAGASLNQVGVRA
jgi:hypothetical protein